MFVGPADDIARVLQELPRALADTGLSLQPQRHNYGHLAPSRSPIIRYSDVCCGMQEQMKDPKGLVILREALRDDPTDPYPVGTEAFIQDHLRDAVAAVANDLRKLAMFLDKLDGDTGCRMVLPWLSCWRFRRALVLRGQLRCYIPREPFLRFGHGVFLGGFQSELAASFSAWADFKISSALRSCYSYLTIFASVFFIWLLQSPNVPLVFWGFSRQPGAA